jgi:hypothetical protein
MEKVSGSDLNNQYWGMGEEYFLGSPFQVSGFKFQVGNTEESKGCHVAMWQNQSVEVVMKYD